MSARSHAHSFDDLAQRIYEARFPDVAKRYGEKPWCDQPDEVRDVWRNCALAVLIHLLPYGRAEIAHDGFAGDIIGHYVTREGKGGVVVQQDGTRVVHVYGERWLAPAAEQAAQPDIAIAGVVTVEMIDRAMIEVKNLHPPMRRSDCERLLRAALEGA